MSEQIFSVQQAAERLGMSVETIRRMILEGQFLGARKMRPEKVTSPYVIPECDIQAYERKKQEAIPFSLAAGQ